MGWTNALTWEEDHLPEDFTLNLSASPQLSSLSCTPGTLGSGQGSTCTVTLTKPATSTVTVMLSSSASAVSLIWLAIRARPQTASCPTETPAPADLAPPGTSNQGFEHDRTDSQRLIRTDHPSCAE